jgi:hypothetical protein
MNLDHLLKTRHLQNDLHLEDNEDMVWLKKGRDTLAIWTKQTMLQPMLEEADKYLALDQDEKAAWGVKVR